MYDAFSVCNMTTPHTEIKRLSQERSERNASTPDSTDASITGEAGL